MKVWGLEVLTNETQWPMCNTPYSSRGNGEIHPIFYDNFYYNHSMKTWTRQDLKLFVKNSKKKKQHTLVVSAFICPRSFNKTASILNMLLSFILFSFLKHSSALEGSAKDADIFMNEVVHLFCFSSKQSSCNKYSNVF